MSNFQEFGGRSKNSNFLLFAPMLWSSEVWQNSAYNIQRTIQNIVLFTRVVSE